MPNPKPAHEVVEITQADREAGEGVEAVARAICQSGKFETGEGTCAPICMEFLGDPRKSGCGHACRVHEKLARAVIASTPSGYEREIAEMRGRLRMIVSHATGGSSQDIDASVNDICVRISANRNLIYQAGKDRALEDAAKVAENIIGGRGEIPERLRIATAIRALKESAR